MATQRRGADRRGELVRGQRDQRARDAGGGAGEPEVASQAGPARERSAELVVVSAKSAAALDAAASRLADHVETHPEQSVGDIAYSLATTRSHHEHRLALAVSTREKLVSASGSGCARRDRRLDVRARRRACARQDGVAVHGPGLAADRDGARAVGKSGRSSERRLMRPVRRWIRISSGPLREVMWADAGRSASKLDETGMDAAGAVCAGSVAGGAVAVVGGRAGRGGWGTASASCRRRMWRACSRWKTRRVWLLRGAG